MKKLIALILLILLFVGLVFSQGKIAGTGKVQGTGSAVIAGGGCSYEAGYSALFEADTVSAADGDPISTWNDGVAGSLELTASGTGRPTYETNEINSKPILRFDGSDDFMVGAAISNYISAANYTTYSVGKVITITTDEALLYPNDFLFSDDGAYFGQYYRSFTPTTGAYNWDGTGDGVEAAITTGAYYIVKMRHTGGNLYISINGGSETSVASGDTEALTGLLRVGRNGGTVYTQVDVAALVFYNSSITSTTTRDCLNTKYQVY